jgi:O-antigen ligase
MIKKYIEHTRFFLVAIMLVVPVFLYSGKTAYALLLLEVTGGLLLAATLMKPDTNTGLSKLGLFTIVTLLLIPVLYLIPVPLSLWESLPGRSPYLEAVDILLSHDRNPWLSLSIIPQKTLHALLALTPLIAIFLATASLPENKQLQLVYIFIGVASFQAFLGLVQYTNPQAHWAFLELSGKGNASGTYLNRDHFSALMHISLPVCIALIACNIGSSRANRQRHSANTNALTRLQKLLIFSCAALLILLGGIFSRSRAGVFLIMLAIILSTLLFARHIGGKRSAGMAATIATLGLGSAVSIGLIPVLNRFIVKSPTEDLRWTFFADAWEGIKTFSPLGSGPGTFQEIYRTLQPVERLQFINHVHNDYLELLYETGVAGGFILLLFLLLYVQGWVKIKLYQWDSYRFVKTAAGLSLFLIALHSIVDFNMHTPANAVFVVFLAALFLSRQSKDQI